MKKNLSLWVLGITAMLASCSQDDALQNTPGEGIMNMTVTASLSGGINTRATDLTADELGKITSCKLLVYNQSTQTGEIKEGVLSGSTFTFDLRLASNVTYDFYCWADNGSSYTVANDGSITMNTEKPAIAQRAEQKDVTPTDRGSVDLSLSNAVAKLVLATTGNISTPAAISLTAKTYKSYDLIAGTVTGTTEEDIVESVTDFTTSVASETAPAEVLSFYVLVGNDSPNQTVTVKYGSSETPVANVPLKPDYRTLLKGDLSQMNKAITITAQMDENWYDEKQPINATAEKGVIKTTRAGQIVANPDLISTAIQEGKLAIEGPMNAEDLTVVANYIKENSDTNVELDLGNASGLTQIPESCFEGSSNLTAIVLPQTLVATPASPSDAVGYNAFSGTGITSITVPAGITCPNNFCNIPGLTEIHLMGNISGLGSSFISYCGSLTDIYFHNTTSAPWIGNTGGFAGFTKSNVTVHLPVGTDTEAWRTAYNYWNDFKYSADIKTE